MELESTHSLFKNSHLVPLSVRGISPLICTIYLIKKYHNNMFAVEENLGLVSSGEIFTHSVYGNTPESKFNIHTQDTLMNKIKEWICVDVWLWWLNHTFSVTNSGFSAFTFKRPSLPCVCSLHVQAFPKSRRGMCTEENIPLKVAGGMADVCRALSVELKAPFQRPVSWQALIGSDAKVLLSACRRLMA